MSKAIKRRSKLIKRGLMLTVFKFDSYKEDDPRPIPEWIAGTLFDAINNNPFYEIGSREKSRHLETFDIELRKGMIHEEKEACPTCGRPAIDRYKLKLEGYTFAVEKAVANTVKEAAEKMFPKLVAMGNNAAKRNVTDDFLKACQDISVEDWTKLNAQKTE